MVAVAETASRWTRTIILNVMGPAANVPYRLRFCAVGATAEKSRSPTMATKPKKPSRQEQVKRLDSRKGKEKVK